MTTSQCSNGRARRAAAVLKTSWRARNPAPERGAAVCGAPAAARWEVRRRSEFVVCCGWSRTTQPRSVLGWRAIVGLGLASLLLSFPCFAQQIIHGEPSQASAHVVVNFRGLVELERLYGLGSNSVPNAPPRKIHPPYPHPSRTNNEPPAGTPAASAPAANPFQAAA